MTENPRTDLSNRIEVIVENAKVYLMGLVTQEEAKRTVNSVQEVSGIKAIIKVFEYISNAKYGSSPHW